MTEALDWASKWESAFVTPYATGRKAALVKIYNEQMQSKESAESRHAAELLELKERFSEAVSLTLRMLTPYPLARDEAEDILIPFILPAPDPVSEWLAECSEGRVSDHTMMVLRLFHNWLSEKETRKIGEAGE